jgi:hypothetical protein
MHRPCADIEEPVGLSRRTIAKKGKGGASARPEQVSVATLGSSETKPRRGRKAPMEKQYVGIDLHRRRSVIVRRTAAGETLETVRIANDPMVLAAELAKAGPEPEVVLEATYGWVRHEAPYDRVGCKDPPAACRSRPLKLEAA